MGKFAQGAGRPGIYLQMWRKRSGGSGDGEVVESVIFIRIWKLGRLNSDPYVPMEASGSIE